MTDLDKKILQAIHDCKYVPNVKALRRALRIRDTTLSSRLEANPSLVEAMEQRGREYIDQLPEEQLKQMISEGGRIGWLPDYAKNMIYARLDAIIFTKIEECDRVPTAWALAKTMDVSHGTISRRLEVNASLAEAMEHRGREYLEQLPEERIKFMVSGSGSSKLPNYAKNIIHARLDTILLREIKDFDGIPTLRALGNAIGIHHTSISSRLEANPSIWIAYYARRGLTPDQAVELALERKEESQSASLALSQRLKNLSAFREMIGLIRCLGNLLAASVAEVSLYPQPLAKAAKELGLDMDVHHVPMDTFRKEGCEAIPRADTVVLQSIHRLSAQALTNLFQELHKNYPYSAVIATFSTEHLCTDSFLGALRKNGYEVKESGIMSISPPDDETLRSCGIQEDDISRVRAKMACQFSVLLLDLLPGSEETDIPELEKISTTNGKAILSPDAQPIDVPDEANQRVSVRFSATTSVLSSMPFVVDIEEGGRRLATVGYDMHPKRGNLIEADVYPGAPADDYLSMARMIARNARLRNRIGVARDRVPKVERAVLRK